MTSKGRARLIALLVLVGIVALATLLVPLLLPRDAIRAQVAAYIERQLRRPVAIGSLSIALWPGPRVALTDVSIGEAAQGPPTRIEVGQLVLRSRLLPLLRGRVEVTSIVIRRPQVEIFLVDSTLATGAPAPGSPPGAPTAPATLPLGVQIRDLRIEEGRVLVHAPDGRPLLRLAGVGEQLSAEATTTGQIALRGTTAIDTLRVHLPAGTLGRGLRIELRKDLTYDLHADRLTLREAALDLGDLPVAVTGEVSGLAAGKPVGELSFSGGPAEVASILAYLPEAMVPEIEGVRSQGTLALTASVRGPLSAPALAPGQRPRREDLPEFRFDLTLTGGRVEHPRLTAPIEGLTLTLRADPDTVAVEEFTARCGESRLQARATVTRLWETPYLVLGLDAAVDLAAVSALQAHQDSLALTGRLDAQLMLTGPIDPPEALQATGTVRVTDAAASGALLPLPITAAGGTVVLQGRDVEIPGLSARVGRSDLRLNGRIANFMALDPRRPGDKHATLLLTLYSRLLDLDEWMPPPGETGGRGLQAAGPPPAAAAPAAMLAKLNGRLDLQVDELRVNHLTARNARGAVELHGGVLDVTGFAMEAFGGQVGAKGEIDLRQIARPAFDLHLQVAQAQAAELFAYAAQMNRLARLSGFLSGRVDLDARLAGTLNDSLQIDLGSLSSNGRLQTTEAKLAGQPLQTALAGYLNAPALGTLDISDWVQPFRIENGRLVLDGMSLKAGDVEVSGSGWQAIDGSLALSLELLLPQAMSASIRSQVPAELVPIVFGAGERVLLPLRISGSLPRPGFALDTERLRAGATRRAEERLKQEVTTRAGDLLQDLLGGRPDSTAADSSAAAAPAQEIERQVKDALKGLFKKKK